MQKLLIKIIRFYQKTFSPDHGPVGRFFPHVGCRFHPSCSEYAVGAVEKYGALRGALKAVWRVLRCGPWSKGGVDLP